MIGIAVWLLTFSGVALVVIGGYFGFGRPAVLPEDVRFMRTSTADLLDAAPALLGWLKRVFWVMGGYVASTGVLVVYVANTGVRSGQGGALAVLAVVWVASIGVMAVVNALIGSDFKRPILGLAGVWAVALVLAAAGR